MARRRGGAAVGFGPCLGGECAIWYVHARACLCARARVTRALAHHVGAVSRDISDCSGLSRSFRVLQAQCTDVLPAVSSQRLLSVWTKSKVGVVKPPQTYLYTKILWIETVREGLWSIIEQVCFVDVSYLIVCTSVRLLILAWHPLSQGLWDGRNPPLTCFLVYLFQDSTLSVTPISRVGGYFDDDEVRPPVVDPGCCTLYCYCFFYLSLRLFLFV